MELFAQLNEFFSYSGSIGYADAKYDSYSNCGVSVGLVSVPFNCDDNQIANSPDWTANNAVNLSYPLPNLGSVALLGGVEWAYRGDVYYSVENDPQSLQEGFSLFNANIGLGQVDGRWALTLWGQNITDEEYAIIAVNGFTSKVKMFGPPRTWGVRLNTSF